MPRSLLAGIVASLTLGMAGSAHGAPPDWLKELAASPLPAQPSEVTAVQLLDDVELVIASNGSMVKRIRQVIRILRREGAFRAVARAPEDRWNSVRDMRGWLIPAEGKSVELRLKDAVVTSLADVQGGQLMTDQRLKVLGFEGAEPGDVVGFEYEIAVRPLEMADTFGFQDTIPVREARYTLKLPQGWSVLPTWINHAAIESVGTDPRHWQWTLKDVPAVPVEAGMPAWQSVAGQLFVAFSPPGKVPQLSTWTGIGSWFRDLAKDRSVASEPIRRKVAELVVGAGSDLQKIRRLADYVQNEVRYVSIQLGIGGFQPHAAADVFRLSYGDCKDKATLLGVMLAEIGIESIPVIVNSERTRVRADDPPSLQFNHMIVAIKLPPDAQEASLLATMDEGGNRLLYFDPTDEFTPFGRIRGELQGNVGLLALPDNSRLVTLPKLNPDHSGVRRTAKLVLDEQGVLAGEINERIAGQEATVQRALLRAATRDADTVRIIEAQLAQSLTSFRTSEVTLRNRGTSELPLEWDYRISASSYARHSGNLVMVRPRVLGVYALVFPDQDKPRVHDLVLSEPRLDEDEVIIDLPAGYAVDSIPPPVTVDAGFAIYRSHSEVTGSQLKHSRSYEVRDLLVPAGKFVDFLRLQREIARDERAVVILRRSGS